MKLAGIDIDKFKPHSVRSAATSAAKKAGVSVDIIMKATVWKNESTFRKFYDKPIADRKRFSKPLLDKFCSH